MAALPTGASLEAHGYDKATVVAKPAAHVRGLLATLQRRAFSATSLRQQMTELPSVLRLMQLVSRVLTGALIVFSLGRLLRSVASTRIDGRAMHGQGELAAAVDRARFF